MKKQKTSSFKHSLLIVAAIISSYLYNIVVWADKWTFSKPVEIARQQAGVFHHVDSSGRQNISAGDNGVFMVWEDNRSGTPSIYIRTASGDGKFSPAIKISGAGEAYDPVAQEFTGGHIVGWEETGQIWLRTFTEEGLGVPIKLSDKNAGHINLTNRNKDELLAVWSESTEQHRRIMYAGLGIDAGRLHIIKKSPLDIRPGAGDQDYPIAAYHESMTTYVVMWEDRRYKNVMMFSAMGTVKDGFSVGMQANELKAPISGLYGVASGVARGALTTFNKYVAAVWSDKRNFRFGYDVFAAFARNSGRFGANQIVQDGFAEGYEQWHPTIAGMNEDLAVAWDDDRDGDSDIWLSYYTGHGWSDDIAVPGASGRGIQTHPSLAMDSSSELHLVWVHRDQEGGPTRVRYLRGTLSR